MEKSKISPAVPSLHLLDLISSLALWAFGVYLIFINGAYYWSTRWIQDDAYITFRYAKNLVLGHGLVFNPHERVEGYTNFLWVLISAVPLLWGSQDPIHFVHIVSLMLWIGTYTVLAVAIWRSFDFYQWLIPLILVPLSYNYSFNYWFFSGMETPLTTFLISLTILFLSESPRLKWKPLVWASVFATLSLMDRMDSIFFLAGAGLVVIASQLWSADMRVTSKKFCLDLALPFILIYGSYTVWRVSYYGDFFPNTYYAKLAYLPFYERGINYLFTFLKVYPFFSLFPLLAGAVFFEGKPRRVLLIYFVGVIATAFYLMRLGGDFMEWRFLTPYFGIIYVGIFCFVSTLIVRIGSWPFTSPYNRKIVAFTFVCAALIGMNVYLGLDNKSATERAKSILAEGQESIPSLAKYSEAPFLWREIGRAIRDNFGSSVKLATPAAGMIPFYCDCPVLDLYGLTDKQIALSKRKFATGGRGRVGHEFQLTDINTMRNRGMDLYLDWPALNPTKRIGAYTVAPTSNSETVSMRLENGTYVDLVLLNPLAPEWEKFRAVKDGSMEFYADRQKGIQTVELKDLQANDHDGTPWNDPACHIIEVELRVPIDPNRVIKNIRISLDHNDKYAAIFSNGEQILKRIEIGPTEGGGGMHGYDIPIMPALTGVNSIVVTPMDGDSFFSIGHLLLD